MEVTIHIPNEEYKELTDRQRTGLAALMQLESLKEMTSASSTTTTTTKEKKQRKSKASGTKDPEANVRTEDGIEETAFGSNDNTEHSDGKEESTEEPSNVESPKDTEVTEQPTATQEEPVQPTATQEEPVQPTATQEEPVQPTATQEEPDVPSINDIQRAGAFYITKNPGEIPKMQEVFKEFGIEKITDLKDIPDKIPSFVGAIRALGVEI